jgi:hypothetical protein
MREQWVQMQLTDASNKINTLANGLLNIRANYAILVKALEIAGVLTPDKFQAAVDFLAKASDATVPPDPAEQVKPTEAVKEPENGDVLPNSDVRN